VADLVMTIMDMETVVRVVCAWEAKVNGRVEVHNPLLDTFSLLSFCYVLSFSFYIINVCPSGRNCFLLFIRLLF
jgi:hypothetical protein